MSFEFSQETRQMLLSEPECGECGRNANTILSIHHINGRTSNSILNGITLCFYCHDRVTMSKEEQIKYLKTTWKLIQREYPDYQIKTIDKEFLEMLAKKWGMSVNEILKQL